METGEKVRRPRIDAKRFVEVWVRVANEGGTVSDVAQEMGCSVAGAGTKWKKLCEEGACLPELPTGKKKSKVDIDEINSYIKANLK